MAKVSALKKLEMLYGLMNELGKAVQPYTPCQKGCNACCHYPVSVTSVEIRYIEKHSRRRRGKRCGEPRDFMGSPCPFLENGACAIYAARPFVCRRHHALTPTAYWCAPDRSTEHEFPMIRFTGVDAAFDHIVTTSKSLEHYDIRQVFN